MIALRPYQHELACEVIASFEVMARTNVAVLPTGGGKSVVIAYIAALEKGRVWVIAHRAELLRQLSSALDRVDLPHGMVKAGMPFDPTQRIQVASIQTLARRHHLMPPPDLIIYDESHHLPSKVAKATVGAYPRARVLGVTATPCRLSGQGLGEVFQRMILGPSARWLTDHGFLCPAEYYGPPAVANVDSLHTRAGDYAKDEMDAEMNRSVVTGDAIEHYRNICDGVPMIVFCTSVKHAKDVAQAYCDAGYRATSVDGALSDEERAERIEGLGSRYQVLTSCELIGEGLDVPCVSAVQLLRPTQSLGLFLQMVGRALRPMEGKTAYVLDHVGNVRKHGFATTERSWTLEGRVKAKKADAVKPVKTCLQCFLVHEPSPSCPHCGYEYPKKTKAEIESVSGSLVRMEETKEERKEALKSARSMVELIAFAKARGYKKPVFWARQVYYGRNHIVAMPRNHH
jgi:DNA repair protein RadD